MRSTATIASTTRRISRTSNRSRRTGVSPLLRLRNARVVAAPAGGALIATRYASLTAIVHDRRGDVAEMPRIVIADDHAVVRKGLRLILADNGMEVAGEAESADELLSFLRTRPVDAVILDVGLGDRDGIEVLKHIRAEFPRLPVLVISVHSEEVFAMRALRAGAAGFIEKAAPPE